LERTGREAMSQITQGKFSASEQLLVFLADEQANHVLEFFRENAVQEFGKALGFNLLFRGEVVVHDSSRRGVR
jgi:hypothetical protein